MSVYKASLYNYLFNSINSIVMIVNGIIMVPLYFHYMSVATYGAWLASGNLVAMIGLLEAGFSGVITQKMASAIATNNREGFLSLAGSNILTAGIISILIFALGSCFIPFIANIVNADAEWASDITIAYTISLLSSAIAVLVSLFGAFPQVWQQTRQVGIINTCVNIWAIVVMVVCLLLGKGVVSLALGYLARSSTNLLIQGYWIMRHWRECEKEKPVFRIKESISLLRECFYPMLAKVSGVLMSHSQSLILAALLAPTAAAIYDITSKVISCANGFVSMANGSFFALLSIVFGKNDKAELNRVVGNIIQYFTICVIGVFVFGVCFSKAVVYYWVGLDKYGGDFLLIAVGIASLVNLYKAFFNNLLFTSGNIKKSSIIDMFSLIVYITSLALSIRLLGVYSVPVSLFITNVLFGGWYLHTLLSHTMIDKSTVIRPIMTNLLLTVPFILVYIMLPIRTDSILQQLCYFVVNAFVFIGAVLTFNKGFYIQVKKKICRK